MAFIPIVVFSIIFVLWTDKELLGGFIFGARKPPGKGSGESVKEKQCYHLVKCRRCDE